MPRRPRSFGGIGPRQSREYVWGGRLWWKYKPGLRRGCGVVFKVTSSGQQSVLHNFTGGTDGQYPLGVVMDTNENLYGTTYFGGVNNCGIVYELTAASGYA